jgi:hypothetical protein
MKLAELLLCLAWLAPSGELALAVFPRADDSGRKLLPESFARAEGFC